MKSRHPSQDLIDENPDLKKAYKQLLKLAMPGTGFRLIIAEYNDRELRREVLQRLDSDHRPGITLDISEKSLRDVNALEEELKKTGTTPGFIHLLNIEDRNSSLNIDHYWTLPKMPLSIY